jgi:hypothetical protein
MEFNTSRSKSAMLVGNFLLFSSAKRLIGEYPVDSKEAWKGFTTGFKVVTSGVSGELPTYAELLEEVGEELSFFVNGVDFETELLMEIDSLLHPEHVHPIEYCWACRTPEEFKKEFNMGENWREGRFLGIKESSVLDDLAGAFGDLDGVAGFVLAGNPYCSTQLLTELLSSNYVAPSSKNLFGSNVIHEPISTKWRAQLNLKIKEAGYF